MKTSLVVRGRVELPTFRFSGVAYAQFRPDVRECLAVYGCVRALTAAVVAVTVAVRDTGRPFRLKGGESPRLAGPRRKLGLEEGAGIEGPFRPGPDRHINLLQATGYYGFPNVTVGHTGLCVLIVAHSARLVGGGIWLVFLNITR